MKTKLSVGDIIEVDNPMRKKEFSFYRVSKIEGNRAFTKFRVLNTKIYRGIEVYEYGKKQHPVYSNSYYLSSEDEAKKYNAEIQ